MTERPSHPLHGVRLGKMDRWLLTHAPTPDAIFGLVLDEPDPSTRETVRRAAVKLEKVGLLERHRMQVYVRASDPRAQGLVFRDGAFWRRADATRAHAARRNVVWLSPFGFQIVLRYRSQLESGEPIRWDARTVNRAFEKRKWMNSELRRVQLNEREESERDDVVLADRSRRKLVPVVSPEVSSADDFGRWEAAVALARHRAGDAPAQALWDLAVELWTTSSTSALQRAAAEIPRRAPTRGERFRAHHRSPLGARRRGGSAG